MLLFLLACTADPGKRPDSEGGEPTNSSTYDMFDPDHVIEVELTMDPADWDALRYQSRSFYGILAGDCLAQPFESPFTYFDADVTIDGEVYPDIQVRKKGFIGSLSATRPSLKIDFEDTPFQGLQRLNLNGTPQDPTMLRTCLAYSVYAAAGVPAPRCSFANVVVNGESLGIYATVEAVDEQFLDRAFGNHEGELFEGTLSDFREGWLGTFDPDTDNADVAHLQPIVDALTVADSALYATLEPLIDMEAFHTFWAAEVLVGQWDGYTSNTNNFYVYLNPTDGKMHFIPWGPDGAFAVVAPFGEYATAWEVANAQLAYRLIQTDEGEARHRARVEQLLDDTWDAAALLAEVDRMEALIEPYWTISWSDRNNLKTVIEETESAIRDSLSDDPAIWPDELRGSPCLEEIGSITTSFTTTWDSTLTQNAYSYGDSTMTLLWDGATYSVPDGTCVAGSEESGYAAIIPVLMLGEATIIPYLTLPPMSLVPDTLLIDGFGATATLYYADASTNGSFVAAGYIGGEVTFTQASTQAGATITGELSGTVYVSGG